jgi:hypothetical protein
MQAGGRAGFEVSRGWGSRARARKKDVKLTEQTEGFIENTRLSVLWPQKQTQF